MSRYTADRVAADLNGKPAFYNPQSIDHGLSGRGLGALRMLAEADPAAEIAHALARRAELTSAYGYGNSAPMNQKPFAFADGVAIIPVHGLLINRFPYSWGFVTGYNFVRDQVAAASADVDVKLICFDINSYGGTVAGCQETADVIFASRKDRPSLAMVDAACYSAAYYLGSQATRVAVTPSGGVGSIGVIAMRVDLSAMLEAEGVKITLIHAGEYKADGSPYEAMSAAEQERLQTSVDEYYGQFVATVARGRPMTVGAVRDTKAGCFQSNEALRIKLVDAITAPTAAVQDALCPDDDQSDDEDEGEMSTPATPANTANPAPTAPDPAALAEAAASARTAERERINGILALPEAKDRPRLAQHLATSTDTALAAAQTILAAAGVETVVAPASNPLEAAMASNPNPDIAQGGPGAGTSDDKVAEILAAQALVTGRRTIQEKRL